MQVIQPPKLLTNYNKTINNKCELPARLLIPTTSFIVTFSSNDYLGIKKTIDKANVSCS